MAAGYSFVSIWRLPVPAERTWRELERMLTAPPSAEPAGVDRPEWWPGVSMVHAPRALAVGEPFALVVRSPLGYRLRVRLEITRVEPRSLIGAESSGDLRGSGSVAVAEAGSGSSTLTFRWDVRTERRWMNATAWALRPAFERAHARVMRSGERGLVEALAGHPG